MLRFDDSTPVKRVLDWKGFRIGLQYFPFQERHGKTLMAGYGHLQKTKGADGMSVDVYVGTNLDSPRIFVVDQYVNGEFDEEKMIIGVSGLQEARDLFLSAMPPEMMGGIREITLDQLGQYRTTENTKADSKTKAEHYAEYDRRTNKKMREHNKAGGNVRKPVRKATGASEKSLYDRAKFNSRKAQQIISRGDPLVDDKGMPTPAAMQFKRWGEKVPKNQKEVKAILARANRQKEAYKAKQEKSDSTEKRKRKKKCGDCGGKCECQSCQRGDSLVAHIPVLRSQGYSDAYIQGWRATCSPL